MQDSTTHPWFSRRAARLFEKYGHRDVVLEEVPAQGHWWWDSFRPNDGGVVNDQIMRDVYVDCLSSYIYISIYFSIPLLLFSCYVILIIIIPNPSLTNLTSPSPTNGPFLHFYTCLQISEVPHAQQERPAAA